jgi:hypothetical protein
MKRFILTITSVASMVAALLSVATLAYAETAAPAAGASLTQSLITIANALIPVAVTLVAGMATIALAKLKQRYNLQVSADTMDLVQKAAESAVQMTAEKAAAYAKAHDNILPGSAQLDMALSALRTRIPQLTAAQADQEIHAALARIPGLGATRDAAYVAPKA